MSTGMTITVHEDELASSLPSLGLASARILRQGRAFSKTLLGIRENMSRWQIFRKVVLSIMAVTLIIGATMRYFPLMRKISEFHGKMPGRSRKRSFV